ncbi:transposase [Candidatus Parcubacteria bacterium]|nr:transposase [Candidatus Parcubacteria bacterium]
MDKRVIFNDKTDYDRFIKLLYLTNGTRPIDFRKISKGLAFVYEKGDALVDIGAYCLMPNHFHLVIKEKQPGGISTFMLKLLTSYSMYFNARNSRKGRLFEASFHASHADSDEYLKYLFAYIHLNPVKIIDSNWKENGIINKDLATKYLEEYEYSSFQDYVGKSRDAGSILNKVEFPEYFRSPIEFTSSIFEWFDYPTKAKPLFRMEEAISL